MGDITEYERRIAAALDRIGYGLDRIGPARGADPAALAAAEQEIAALHEALDGERAAAGRLAQQLADAEARVTAASAARPPQGAASEARDEALANAAAEVLKLRAALEEERSRSLDLRRRLEAAPDTEPAVADPSAAAEIERLNGQLETQAAELRKMRRVNGQLRESNQALRHAVSQGLGDAALIDRAMQAELDALRHVRDAEAAEMDEILAELKPLVESAMAAAEPPRPPGEGFTGRRFSNVTHLPNREDKDA